MPSNPRFVDLGAFWPRNFERADPVAVLFEGGVEADQNGQQIGTLLKNKPADCNDHLFSRAEDSGPATLFHTALLSSEGAREQDAVRSMHNTTGRRIPYHGR